MNAPERPTLRAVQSELRVPKPLRPIDFVAAHRPPAAVVAGVLAESQVTAMVGAYGVGKTTLALDLARAICTGAPWLGADVRKGSVLFIETDSPPGSISKRLFADRDLLMLDGLFLQADLGPMPFTHPETIGGLLTRIKDIEEEFAVQLVIVDSILATMPLQAGGVDQAISNARSWVAACRMLAQGRRAVLGLGHFGKDTSRGLLGTVALPAALDAIISVKPTDGGLLLSTGLGDGGKPRDFPAASARVRLSAEGDCVRVECASEWSADDSPRRAGPRGRNQRQLIDLLREILPRSSNYRDASLAGRHDWPNVPVKELRDRWVEQRRAANPGARVTPSRFDEALGGLITAGTVAIEGEQVFLP